MTPSLPKLEVFPESDRVFFHKIVDAKITFEVDSRGHASSVVSHQNGRDWQAGRIDEAEARRIEEQQPKQHKEVEVDPKLFNCYVGRFKLGPKIILTISRD